MIGSRCIIQLGSEETCLLKSKSTLHVFEIPIGNDDVEAVVKKRLRWWREISSLESKLEASGSNACSFSKSTIIYGVLRVLRTK